MKVVLELQDQQSNIKKVTVRHDIVIGRGAECNLRLSAPQVSRRHCFLRITDEGAFVSDLDSSNGTFLNDNKLTSGKRYALEDGASFAVGPVRFIAHVRSEVVAADVLQVSVTDDRIEAEETEQAAPSAATTSDSGEYMATVSQPVEESGQDDAQAMNLAVEQAGAAADEDDPTADYVATSPSASGMYTTGSEYDVLPEHDDETTVADADAVEKELNDSKLLSVDDEFLVIDDDDELPSAEVLESPTEPVENLDDSEKELRDFLSGLD